MDLSLRALDVVQIGSMVAAVICGLLLLREIGRKPTRKQLALTGLTLAACIAFLGIFFWSTEQASSEIRSNNRQTVDQVVKAELAYYRATGHFTDSRTTIAGPGSSKLRGLVENGLDGNENPCSTFCLEMPFDRDQVLIVVTDDNGDYAETQLLRNGKLAS